MDPWTILGLMPKAGVDEARAAHARLRAALEGTAGTAELRGLVDRALQAIVLNKPMTGRRPDASPLLGVPPGAQDSGVHAAYRRLARVVHPDSGGTAELFRLVADARRALTTRPPRRSVYVPPPRPRPRPKPRPPVAYVPPRADARVHQRRARAWLDVVVCGSLLAGVMTVAGAALALWGRPAVPFLAMLLLPTVFVSRPALVTLARATVILLGSRVKVPPSVEPELFLADRCLGAPVERQRHDLLYAEYQEWCHRRGVTGVAPWIFVERLRSLGLLYVKLSAWDQGLWVGIRLRSEWMIG